MSQSIKKSPELETSCFPLWTVYQVRGLCLVIQVSDLFCATGIYFEIATFHFAATLSRRLSRTYANRDNVGRVLEYPSHTLQ